MSEVGDVDIRRLDGLLLLVFRELMRHRNASMAAKRLRLSQSGVSHALGRLRDAFGDPLFVRRSHGLEPTGLALELAPKIEALIALAQDALGSADFDPARSTRQFHIGAAEFLISLTAAPLLRRLECEAPNASVVFRHFVGEDAVGALQRGEIDLALGQFETLPRTVVCEPMFTDGHVVVVREGHPALQGDGIDLETFARLNHVMVSPTGSQAGRCDPALAALGVHRRIVGVVPRYLTAFGVVAATDAAVLAPRPLALRYAARFGLKMTPPPFHGADFEVSAIHLRETSRDTGPAWLLGRLREITARDEAIGASAFAPMARAHAGRDDAAVAARS